MLLNLSHELAKQQEIISTAVGKPFDMDQRKKLDGISIADLPVTAASIDLYNLMVLNDQHVVCHIEMRPEGVILSFRVKQDTYALVIPFYKLKIYKGRAEEYTFYKDHYFIKIWAGSKQTHRFVKKLKGFQTDTAHPRIEDLPH